MNNDHENLTGAVSLNEAKEVFEFKSNDDNLEKNEHHLSKTDGEMLVRNSLRRALDKSKNGTLDGLKSGDILTVLNSMKSQIAQALPKHLTAERIIQVATTYLNSDSKIKECTITSVVAAIVQSSVYGLELAPAFGHCYLVPYNNKSANGQYEKQARFQIGYQGYIALAYRSGEIKNIYAEVVREGDHFECELGLEPKLRHVPNPDCTGDEKITHAYAVVHYKAGGYNFIVLTRNKIESLRKRSASQKSGLSGAWATDYDAMCKAKAISQLRKYMPMATEMQRAGAADGAILNLSNCGAGAVIEEQIFEE